MNNELKLRLDLIDAKLDLFMTLFAYADLPAVVKKEALNKFKSEIASIQERAYESRMGEDL